MSGDCEGCNDYPWIVGVCRCCFLVDKDKTKKKVKFCWWCQVHLCEECRNNIPKRILAFGYDILSKK